MLAELSKADMMLYLIAKAALSGVIIAAASELARRNPTWGALILSLPLISILAMIWLWRDTGDNQAIASLAQGTFWLVLPTLPLFLVLPALLRNGVGFWLALSLSCLLTIGLYLLTVWLLPKLGVSL
jgi:glycopeptide antibiotics resistance protein